MKNLKKKITSLGITISGMMYSTLSLAATAVKPDIDAKTGTNATNAVSAVGANILGMVSTAASVLSVIVLIILGIKYMMGSTEEKAEYKKTLLPYFIGAFFVFGAGLIASVIFNMAQTDWTKV